MATEEHKDGATRVQFGLFEADLKTGELRRSGVRVRLQGQPFKLLAALLKTPGEVVSREALQQQLWGSDTTVDFDHSLGIAVNKLRDALGDHAENPRFVETLAKRGYRFIAPVKPVEPRGARQQAESALPVAAPAPQTAKAATVPWLWITAALACVCLGLTLALLLRMPSRKPYRVVQVTDSGHLLANDPEVESFSSTVSDGARLYFSHMDNGNPVLAVALAANGEISPFRLPPEIGAPLIGALAPDGSKLLVHSHLQADPEQPLWIVPTLGGEARRVPNVLVHDATWMPDGRRLLIAHGNDLTVVEPDGSDPHKLITTPGMAFWLRWSPDGRRLRFTLRDPKRFGKWQRMGAIPIRSCPAGVSLPRNAVAVGPRMGRILSSSHRTTDTRRFGLCGNGPGSGRIASPGRSPTALSTTRRPAHRPAAIASTLLESTPGSSCCTPCPSPLRLLPWTRI